MSCLAWWVGAIALEALMTVSGLNYNYHWKEKSVDGGQKSWTTDYGVLPLKVNR
jgi:hypothetical protein